jgi:hypothetical protein
MTEMDFRIFCKLCFGATVRSLRISYNSSSMQNLKTTMMLLSGSGIVFGPESDLVFLPSVTGQQAEPGIKPEVNYNNQWIKFLYT